MRARRLTDQEGQQLQQIVRCGKHRTVRMRRAMIMASAPGSMVPAIARLVAADEDTVRDIIHLFSEQGLVVLNPQWAGGRQQITDKAIGVIVELCLTPTSASWASPVDARSGSLRNRCTSVAT